MKWTSRTRRHLRGMFRRLLPTILLVLVSATGLQACGGKPDAATGAGAASAIPSTLTFGYIGANTLNLPSSPEGWGLYKGIVQEELKKHGIAEVKLVGFPNGPDQSESLISGRIDFGTLGDTPAILARSNGAPTRLINQTNIHLIGYLIGRKDGPQSLQELRGRTIAIQKGSYMHRYVAGLLEKEGIQDVKLVHMLRPDGEAALSRGEVDAMTNSGAASLKLLDQGFALLDDSSLHPELLGTSVTVVSEAYLEKFPDFPDVWNEIRKKSLAHAKQHADEYYAFLAETQNSTPVFARLTDPLDRLPEEPFREEGLKLLESTKNFLVGEKLAKQNFALDDWIFK